MGGILESFLAGKEARRVADAAEQINAMQAFIGQNGQAIMAGDQNALGQLAGFGAQGLQTAMGIQGDLEARQDRAYNRDRARVEDGRADEKWKMEVEAYKASLTAEQAAAEAARIEEAVKGGLATKNDAEWDAYVTQIGAPELVGQFGMREALAMRGMSMAEALKAAQPAEPPKPQTEAAQLKADLDAGLIDLETYKTEMARRAPKNSKISFNPTTGAMSIEEGVGVGSGTGEITVGDVYNPAAASDAVTLIDGILGVDANGQMAPEAKATIEGITGPLEGGGGNDIDAMSATRRMWYGDKGLDKIEKLNQLQSKAWLAARDMLKGGGPITDYESRKAEAAVARLSRAKGSEEFIAALTELRDAITAGEAKLKAARGGTGTAETPAATPPASGNTTSSGVQWSIVE